MKVYTVETANRERNKYLWWLAAAWPFLYLPLIFIQQTLSNRPVTILLAASCVIAAFFTSFAIVKLIKFTKGIKGFPEIERCLREEIFNVYQSKALAVGYWSLIGLLGLLVPVSRVLPMQTYVVCMMLFFIGVQSYLLAWLLYNRD